MRILKTLEAFLFVMLLVILCIQVVHSDLAPDFTLTDIDGTTFSLGDFRGEVVILEFFATYCGSCIEEIPHLKAVKDELGEQVTIISLSIWDQDTDEKLSQFRAGYDIPWILAGDSANVRGDYGVSALPTLFVIDQAGYIKFEHIDEIVEEAVLKEEIRELLITSLTLTTSPSLDNVHLKVDGDDYYTVGGSLNIELDLGQHDIELVNTTIKEGEDTEYRFLSWSGSHSGSSNPIQINITTSCALEVTYDTYFRVTFTESGSGSLFHVTVDETSYTLPQTFWFEKGSSHRFDYESPVSGELGIRYVLTSTSPVSPSQFARPTTVVGYYETQYEITVISAHDSPIPSQWVKEGSNLTVSVTSPSDDDNMGTRYSCVGYSIDNGKLESRASHTFASVKIPHQIEFQWTPQYRMTVNTSPTDLLSYVDVSPHGPWYDAGTIVTCTAQAASAYDFDYWVVDGTPQKEEGAQLVITMDRPLDVTFHYVQARAAPDFTLTDIDGEEFSLKDHRGKVVLLDFFSTLCGTCKEEFPQLKTLYEEFDKDLVIVSISIDPSSDTVETLKQFRQDYDLEWTIARDTTGMSWDYGITSIPAIVILSQEGYVTYRYMGLTDEAILRQEILTMTLETVDRGGLSFGSSWLAFVLAAGAFALLSPCSYPMLPGYISYYIGDESVKSGKTSLSKAVPNGLACLLGLISVFSVIGIFASALGNLISPYIPALELVAGVVMIFLGISVLVKIKFPALPLKAPRRSGLIGIFLYGVVYGLATLGCSAPIFFSILFYAAASGGALFGLVVLIVYALGMGIPLIITTIIVAKAQQLMLKRIARMTPWIQKISGVVLIAIGVYLTYYYLALFL